tara:strand:- start:7710 stop:10013 length:2304 start_codon:yes stop_codon:yes gene_type:complete
VEIASLIIKADSTQVGSAGEALDSLSRKGAKAEKSTDNLTRSTKQASAAYGLLKRAAIAATAYIGAREILRASEAWTTLNNRLRLVTDGAEEFIAAQEGIFAVAQETRQPLTATAELYQRIAQNQEELNLSGKEMIGITKTISQAMVVSGTSTQGAQAAMVQLGQAFASGTLRGEELNAILEQAPALSMAIARGMGVTVGQLRELGKEGELTAEAVIQALQDQGDELQAQFDTMTPTISQAMTTVNNAFTQLVGKMDEASGASGGLAEKLMDVADLLQDPETVKGLAEIAKGVANLTGWFIQGASAAADFARWTGEALAASVNGAALDDIVRVEDEIEELTGKIQRFNQAQESLPAFGKWLDDVTGAGDANAERIATWTARLDQLKRAQKEFYKNSGTNNTGTDDSDSSETTTTTNTTNNTRPPGVSPKGSGKDEAERLTAAIQRQVVALSLEAQTLEMSRTESTLYKLALEGASAAQLAAAESSLQAIDLHKREAEALKRRTEAGTAAEESIRSLITTGNAELDALQEQYDQKQAIFAEALATEYFTKQQHDEAMIALEEATSVRRQEIMEQEAARRQEDALSTMASITTITSNQINQMRGLFDEASGMGKAFFVLSQGLAAANAVIGGFQAAMAIRVAYAQMAAMAGPAAPALLAAGEVHAGTAQVMGFATAGMIAAQTVASFEGGGFTGFGPRSGGLDGKGGFMAMVHPNETVTDHTKAPMQSGSNSITNNFILSESTDNRTQTHIAAKASQAQRIANARFGKS